LESGSGTRVSYAAKNANVISPTSDRPNKTRALRGRLNIRNQRFLDDPAPVQDGCPCLACRSFSRAYLAHLFRADELLAYRLATCHNLTFTLDFMARIRAAIRAGTFPASMPELRVRAGRVRGGEVADKSA
jgi:tRNA-guanine family transglycosylase